MALYDFDRIRAVIWLGAACVLGIISIYANSVYVRRCSVSPIVFLEVAICAGALLAYGFIRVEFDGQFFYHGTRDDVVVSSYAAVFALGTTLQAKSVGGLGDRLQNYKLRKVLVVAKYCLYAFAAIVAPTIVGFGCLAIGIEYLLAILLLIAASAALAIAIGKVLAFP